MAAACGGNKKIVRMNPDQTITVMGKGESETKAVEDAISKANDLCDDEDKKAVFMDEGKKQYTGALPEGVNRTVAKIPGVRSVLSSGDEYLVEMKIKCQ